jgi:hypothetical protein
MENFWGYSGVFQERFNALGAATQVLVTKFEWLGESTLIIKSEALDAILDGAGTGIPLKFLKFLLALFLAYPLGLVFGLLPQNKNLKHFLSFALGFVMMQYVYGPEWFHSIFMAIVTYAICLFCPGKYMGQLAFWVVLGYMVGCHAYKMYTNTLSGLPYYLFPLDFTGTQMVVTMKLTSFAYNVADGIRLSGKSSSKTSSSSVEVAAPAAESDKNVRRSSRNRRSASPAPRAALKDSSDDKNAKKIAARERLEAEQRSFAIFQLPNLLEYLGYVFCFPAAMVGPTFEYTTYEAVINGVKPAEPKGKGTPAKDFLESAGRLVNSNLYVAALHRLLIGVLCMGSYSYLGDVLGYKTFKTYEAKHSAFWNEHTFLGKLAFMFVCMLCERFKFYFIWKFSEGACILAGFGFSGYDKDGNSLGYRAAENIDILGFVRSTNIQVLSRCWNKGTQSWLQRYAYNRVGGSLLVTYFISSVWHGVYPGFFIMFMIVPLLTQIERLMQSKINPRVVPEYDGRNISTYPTHLKGTVYWWVCFAGQTMVFNFITQTFSMGFWTNAYTALASFQWIPQIVWVALLVVLTVIPGVKAKTV